MAKPKLRGPSTVGPSLSTYLDGLRFAAAAVVFVSHVAIPRISGHLLPLQPLVELADDAVMAFFVLSGFVISWTAETRDTTTGAYAKARAARLYSVALPALLLTPIVDTLGRRLDPALYAGWWAQPWSAAVQLGAAVLFVNELWLWSIRPFSDGPYWSLGYEAWYYVLFGIGFFGRGVWRWALLLLVAILVGPKILVLFPLWLLGVGVQALRHRIPARAGWPLFLGSSAAYAALKLTSRAHVLHWWGDYYVVRLVGDGFSRHVPSKYVAATLVGCNLLGFAAIERSVSLRTIERPVRWLAGMTFSLYLFHYPLLHFFASAVPGTAGGVVRTLAIATLAFLGCVALASVTERRKREARRIVDAVSAAIVRRIPWRERAGRVPGGP